MGFNTMWAFRDCPWCGLRDSQMTQMHHVESGQRRDDGTEKFRYWYFLSCPRCGGLQVMETNDIRSQTHRLIQVIPAEDHAVDVEGLPEDVARYYRDAITVWRAGVPGAAAVQLRKTLEAAAQHHGASDGRAPPLVQQLQKLIDDGHVTQVFLPALGYVRKVGNAGAHAGGEDITDDEIRQAMAFTRALLRDLFELPAQIAALTADSPPPLDTD